MKLYVFKCGTLKSQKQFFTAGIDIGKAFEVPVPFFLITHPKGYVLFDTGNALEVAKDKIKHWGEKVVSIYDPIMSEEEYVVNQLAKLNIKAEEIKHVIFSHLHLDHAGACGAFPNATYYVQKEELKHAYVHDFYQKGAYIRADFDKPDLKWYLLDGYEEDPFDLFGDGKIKIIFTPGHTPGHQCLMVDLEHSGKVFLTADSVYTEEILEKDLLPGLVYSPADTVKSIKKVKNLKNQGVKIFTGHDPDAKIKYAPEYYD